MSSSGKIAKNVGALLSSQVITWGLTILLTIVSAKVLGPEGVGSLQIAVSIWAIAGVLITFGTDTLLIKEIARRPADQGRLVGATLMVRLFLFVVSCLLVAGYIVWQRPGALVVELILLLGAAQLLIQISQVATAALYGLELMHYTALNDIVMKGLNTGLGIVVLLLGYKAHGLAAVMIVCGLVALLLQFTLLLRTTGQPLDLRLRIDRDLLRAGLPYLASGLSLTAYGQIDTLVISSLVDAKTVGYYSVAIQLFGTLLFMPSILMTAVFPALSRNFATDPNASVRLVRKSFDLMLLISIPIGFGVAVIADRVVPLIYDEKFAASAPVLALLGLVLVFTYQNVLLGRYFASIDRPNIWTVLLVVATIATIGLDIWLVPLFQLQFGNGALGGAVSYFATEAVMLIVGIALLPRHTLSGANTMVAIKLLAAGGLMVAACWLARSLPLPLEIAIGALVYVATTLLIRVITPEDQTFLRNAAQSLLARLRRTDTAQVAPASPDAVTLKEESGGL